MQLLLFLLLLCLLDLNLLLLFAPVFSQFLLLSFSLLRPLLHLLVQHLSLLHSLLSLHILVFFHFLLVLLRIVLYDSVPLSVPFHRYFHIQTSGSYPVQTSVSPSSQPTQSVFEMTAFLLASWRPLTEIRAHSH